MFVVIYSGDEERRGRGVGGGGPITFDLVSVRLLFPGPFISSAIGNGIKQTQENNLVFFFVAAGGGGRRGGRGGGGGTPQKKLIMK